MANQTFNVTESIGVSDILSGATVAWDMSETIYVADVATVFKSDGTTPDVNQATEIWVTNPYNYVELWEQED